MASVELAAGSLGGLPPVCVVTGEPTAERLAWDFAWVPRRRWLAVLLWSLPSVALAGADPVRLRVALPVSERGQQVLLRRRLRGPLALLLAVAVLGLSAAAGHAVLAVASAGLGLAALALWLVDGRRSPWMVAGSLPGSVRLGGVCPAFVAALVGPERPDDA